MPYIIGLIVQWFAGLAGGIATVATTTAGAAVIGVTARSILWVVQKAFFLFMGTVVLTFVLYKFYLFMFSLGLDILISYLSDNMPGSMQDNLTLTITGYGGWLAGKLKLPECISIMIAALDFRFMMGFLLKKLGF